MDRHVRPGIGLQCEQLDLPPTGLAEILTVPVGSARSGSIPDKNTVLLMLLLSRATPLACRRNEQEGIRKQDVDKWQRMAEKGRDLVLAAVEP